MTATQHSCLYTGWVRHRRSLPKPHHFRYRTFMVYLDLDELDTVFAGRWFWSTKRPAPARFKRRDYLGDPKVPLREAVLDEVEKHLQVRPDGAVRMLTQLRHFGYSFNPVTFYYCFDAGGALHSICAQITNTPWGERHCYVLAADPSALDTRQLHARFRKDFHVSPFMRMTQEYDWRFATPGKNLLVHMQNHEDKEMLFDATLVLKRRPIIGGNLARCLLRYPFMSMQVILAIYWQALRLKLKRIPVQVHPSKADQRECAS